MDKRRAVQIIEESGVIAIMRAQSSDQLLQAADAIQAGGVQAIEVTMTTPGALKVIAEARKRYGAELLFGAGSVLDPETGRAAILAGAQFMVAPTLNLRLIELCRRCSIPVMPAANTPTDALPAWEAGADIVKISPAEVGGPAYLKATRPPLPQLKLCPVGGVDLDTAADFIKSGAACLGVGSALINQKLLDSGDFAELTRRAVRFREEVDKGRGG